ncbi:MAG: hypothetical protein RQ745_03745 [Longimicrobiales bacterium]|nr:hypothetical protein [Longimicrobiales bacterium]
MALTRSSARSRASSTPVLIVGTGVTALGVIRILGRRGIPLWAVPGDDAVTRRSRWFRPAPAAAEGLDLGCGLAPYLKRLQIEGAVLIPCSDEFALETAHLPPDLARRFPSFQPSVATLERVLDKWAFHSVLREHDIPCPATYRVNRPDDTRSIEWVDSRALFVKPRDSQAFFRHFGVKGFMARNREELEELAARAGAAGLRLMVQEYVPGPATNHYFIDGFATEGGAITAHLVRQRLRMFPPDFGNSSAVVTVPTAEAGPALDSLRRLLPALEYRGIFSAEFKQDEVDGSFRILEINARPWWYVDFAARSGLDVIKMVYDAAQGAVPSTPARPCALGRRLVFPYYHLSACIHDRGWARGLPCFLRDLPGAQHPVLALDDPRPGVHEWRRLGGAFLKRRLSRVAGVQRGSRSVSRVSAASTSVAAGSSSGVSATRSARVRRSRKR